MKSSTLILITCLLSGCGLTDNDDNRPLSGEIMPLEVGKWWDYEVRQSQWENPVVDTIRYEVAAEVTVTLEGASYSAFAFNLLPFPEGMPEYYWLNRNANDGLYSMGGVAETDTLFINHIDKKYPVETGETWESPQVSFSRSGLEFYINDTLKITVVDTDREVQTPAGTFRCYVYHFEADQGDDVLANAQIFQFYSPGVGLIKQEDRRESDNQLRSELVLIGYHLQ
ncbi:hypothetical protein BH23BAC3_BH23BAC3_23680 [soil metagenome]